ncbi:hypothetical protein V6N11_011980 [Hibiscus sabdariffa]|uniref:Uncharacterized protein n=1 Tax=Hibiscus sabdariffa TaxID=183260 RepID=A0ABR2PA48_9ROSI
MGKVGAQGRREECLGVYIKHRYTTELLMAMPSINEKCVTIVLLLCQRLCQGICDVVVRVFFTYLHISSIYDLPDEMEAPKNVFGSLMRSGFLCLRNGSIVVTIEIYSI